MAVVIVKNSSEDDEVVSDSVTLGGRGDNETLSATDVGTTVSLLVELTQVWSSNDSAAAGDGNEIAKSTGV